MAVDVYEFDHTSPHKTQVTIFDAIATSRHTDPATSHLAAAAVEASGRAGSDRAKLVRAVELHPGHTAVELIGLMMCEGVTRHNASRRLAELRKAGLVTNGPARVCSVSGTKQMTWEPT